MFSIWKEIKIEIIKFKRWAATVEHIKEWETNYPNWFRIYSLIEKLLVIMRYNTLTKLDKDNLLYLLSRDNELEQIAMYISEYPNIIIPLAKDGLNYKEYEARWQLAHYIWKYGANYPETEKILLLYYQDSNEYVKRRSLLSLGYMNSKYAEQLALESWKSGLEYQKIAALYTLDEINSNKLKDFIIKAEKDEFESVRWNAKCIKSNKKFK